jgi:hypothetical protein
VRIKAEYVCTFLNLVIIYFEGQGTTGLRWQIVIFCEATPLALEFTKKKIYIYIFSYIVICIHIRIPAQALL